MKFFGREAEIGILRRERELSRVGLLSAVCLLLATAESAPFVRLDDAEVGFRMHLGVMKSSGTDVYNRAGEYGTAVQPA